MNKSLHNERLLVGTSRDIATFCKRLRELEREKRSFSSPCSCS
jgi:hypothetical protein